MQMCDKNCGIKGGTTDEAFMSNVFCGKEEFLLVQTLTFLTFKTFYMHRKLYNTHKEQGEKHKSSPLTLFAHYGFLYSENSSHD